MGPNIDSGLPAATGGQAGHFYGMMMVTGGTNAGVGGAPDAGIGGVESFTGGTTAIAPPGNNGVRDGELVRCTGAETAAIRAQEGIFSGSGYGAASCALQTNESYSMR